MEPIEPWDCGDGKAWGALVGGRWGGDSHSQRVAREPNLSRSTLKLLVGPPEDRAGKPAARQPGGKTAGRGKTAEKGLGRRQVENNQHT